MKFILLSLLALPILAGCLKGGNTTPPPTACTYDSCATKAPVAETDSVQRYLTANNIVATKHCSGLYYVIDAAGTGTAPGLCSTVSVSYKGQLTDGTIFDQSTAPIAFNLAQVITGFRNGIPLIKAGGKIRLYVPPSLGYGSTAYRGIPANSILIFTIDLVAVQ